MCTAVSFVSSDCYFGRNLDLEYSYHEEVTITPRGVPLTFRRAGTLKWHYAMIGMAYVADGYPLYYDATNEAGLSMAGLNFPGNADYQDAEEGDCVSPFEFIPWILGQCADIAQARQKLARIRLVPIPFSDALPLSPLHWIIADRTGSIVVESVREGLKVYDNPVGVLTNNPPFDYHLHNLANYMQLSADPPVNRLSQAVELNAYSRGMGAMGLPGDLSSASRFVKAAFTKLNALCGPSEEARVSQFFHILGSVEQQRGCVCLGEGKYEFTLYSSCCNADKGIYYYVTYDNRRICAVDMHRENLDGEKLIRYPLQKEASIFYQN